VQRSLPPGPTPQSTGRTETLDLLELLSRGGEIDESLLVELGVAPGRAAPFVQALERLRTIAQRTGVMDDLQRLRVDTRVGSARIQEGAAIGEDVRTAFRAGVLEQADLEQITPPPDQRVPAHLQKILDGYYRTLAERAQGTE
jgi:hypothetical protein